jgi:hypothetical protein
MPGTTARFLPATYVGPRPFARRYPGCGNFCATRPFKFVRWIEGSAYGRLWSRRGCGGEKSIGCGVGFGVALTWLKLALDGGRGCREKSLHRLSSARLCRPRSDDHQRPHRDPDPHRHNPNIGIEPRPAAHLARRHPAGRVRSAQRPKHGRRVRRSRRPGREPADARGRAHNTSRSGDRRRSRCPQPDRFRERSGCSKRAPLRPPQQWSRDERPRLASPTYVSETYSLTETSRPTTKRPHNPLNPVSAEQ